MLAAPAAGVPAGVQKPLRVVSGGATAAGLGGARVRGHRSAGRRRRHSRRGAAVRGRGDDRSRDRRRCARGAAIAAVPARDTVKLAREAHGDPSVEATIPRDASGWRRRRRRSAARAARRHRARASGGDGTDEAALAEQAGHAVRLVEGDPRNLKITTADGSRAGARVADGDADGSDGDGPRIGTGYDSHRLVRGASADPRRRDDSVRPRPAGHSDADASATRSPTRCSAPPRSATSAGTFPIPIRVEGTPTAWSCCARGRDRARARATRS